MKDWTITRLWEGQTCAVLASGESMTPDVVELIRVHPEVRVIVVNNTYELAPWADLLYAADALWWTAPQNRLNGKCNHDRPFLGFKVCVEDTPYDDVLKIKDGGKEGFDPDPATIRTGGNSGYGAIHIAAHLGCKRILLCGFDMRGGHWHEQHQIPLRAAGEGMYPRWIERFPLLGSELKARGIEVLNCTPNSALRCFQFADLGEVLAPSALAA